jgi:WD40 repeat protein
VRTVNLDGLDDLAATQPASPPSTDPSPADATRTAEPLRPPLSSQAGIPPSLAARPRDPERYQIMGEHGRGGLGRVSRAHDRDLGRDVAIKELISRAPVSEVRFLREALITARLEHPGIVPVHEAGRWPDGTPFYAMKLVAGRPLRELIAERTTVDDRIGLLHHVIAVADAIAYAHGQNIIHRDLKPANVIVGDFGETVVIDWGLAKDVTQPEDSAGGGGPSRASREDGLTSAGAVLGTPAYMAPEQQRGEPVDQRADVFAIGAMLWDLCSLEKLPPGFSGQRRRILRRAGIDRDLATIVDKALDPDPAQRYPEAGAIAADLKAFKAGARIAARRYSLLAMLAHWVRRRRSLALATAAALALVATGSALYVRSIAVERDRADASEASATRARTTAQTSLDALTLQHAELLLATDPSAALDALATYHGNDPDRAREIRSAALAKGIATLRATPHRDNVIWAQGTERGIISLGLDGAIVRTLPGGTSVVLTRGVSPHAISTYMAMRDMLVYECDPDDICALDTARDTPTPPRRILRGMDSVGLALSPNGSKLATISRTAELRVFDLSDLDHVHEIFHLATTDGGGILFVDDDTIAVAGPSGLKLVHPMPPSSAALLPVMHSSAWDADPNEHLLALGTTVGTAYVATAAARLQHRSLCPGRISGIKFMPGQSSVAYACKEGTIGIWDLQTDEVTQRLHLEGHADLIATSADGDYIMAGGGNGTITVLDLVTGIATPYRGHRFRLMTISPPCKKYPFFVSGDVRGAIRAWPPPKRHAHVATDVHRRFRGAFFSGDTLIATTQNSELTTYSLSAGVHTASPHLSDAVHVVHAADRRTFATYGSNDAIEIWSAPDVSRTRTLATNHGMVSQIAFVNDAGEFVSAGRDGRLVLWSSAGKATELAHLDRPIEGFALGPTPGAAIMISSDGTPWRTGGTAQPVALVPGTAAITRIAATPDRMSTYLGDANGNVSVIDATSGVPALVLQAGDAIEDIVFSRDGNVTAISANNGMIYLGVRRGAGSTALMMQWSTLHAQARDIAVTPDGLLVAACTDGSILIYSALHHQILYIMVGTIDLTHVTVNEDASAAAVLDTEGQIIWTDLDTVRAALEKPET